jgi:hypothetical protein
MSVPSDTVSKEELRNIYPKWCDVVNGTTKYDNVTSRLCKGPRKCEFNEETPEDISKLVFPEEILRLESKSTFLRVDHKKNIFAGEY